MIKDDHRLNNHSKTPACIYTYAFREEERALCYLEMRSFFGMESQQIIKVSLYFGHMISFNFI